MDWSNDCEREVNALYAGEIRFLRAGFPEQIFTSRSLGGNDCIAIYKVEFSIWNSDSGADLLLFPYAFQRLYASLCRKSGISKIYGRNPKIFFKTKKCDKSKKDSPHL